MSEYEDDEEDDLPEFNRKKMEDAIKLLDEGCDGYLLIALFDSEDMNHHITKGFFNGGLHQAIGLAEDFKHKLINRAA